MAARPMVLGVDYGPGSSRAKPPTSTQPTPATPAVPTDPRQIMGNAVNQAQQWNQYAQQHIGDATNQLANSPFQQNALNYQNTIVNGDMSNNPFMANVYNKTVGSNLDQTNGMLQNYIGAIHPALNGGGVSPSVFGFGAGGYLTTGGQHGDGGGTVPDTVGNNNSFFAQQIRSLFDPSKLDPMNDPTMQPYINELRNQNQLDLMSSLGDVNASAEANGRYGGSDWVGQNVGARGTAQRSLDQAIATSMMSARNTALQNQMTGLSDTNTRDIAAMNDATNRYASTLQAQAAGYGAAASLQNAAAERQLKAIEDLQNNAQFGLGLQSTGSGQLQSGQLGALGIGQNYDQLGLSALDYNNQLGQLGLGTVNAQNNAGQGIGSYDVGLRNSSVGLGQLALARNEFQQSQEQGSLNNLFNLIGGIGGMGGTNTSQTPGQYVPTGMDPNMAALFGLFGGTMNGANQFGGG